MEKNVIIKSRKELLRTCKTFLKKELVFKNYSEGIIIYSSKKRSDALFSISVEVIDPVFIFFKKQNLKDFINSETLEYLEIHLLNHVNNVCSARHIFKKSKNPKRDELKSDLLELLIPKEDRLTKDQSLKLLSIGRTTLWRYVKSGKLESFGIGHRVYYSKKQVFELLAKINKK